MSEGVQGHLGMSSCFQAILKPSNAPACLLKITHLGSELLEGVKKVKVSWEIFFGFRNALNATMDAENLALAQEEATLTKIRTLLNQHKVGESFEKCHMVARR